MSADLPLNGRKGSLSHDWRKEGLLRRHTSSRGLSISIVIDLLVVSVKDDRYVYVSSVVIVDEQVEYGAQGVGR